MTISVEDTYLERSAASWAVDLTHADPQVRRAGAFALGKLGKNALPHLAMLFRLGLEDANASVRLAVAGALAELGPLAPEESLSYYLRALAKEKDHAVRRQWVEDIGKLGERASRAEKVLIELLDQGDEQLQPLALWSLGQIGKVQEAHIFKIAQYLESPVSSVRREAVAALGNFGTQSLEVLLPIIRTLSDREPGVQEQGVLALRKLGPAASAGIAPLLTLAEKKSSDATLRQAALITLENIWPTGAKEPSSWDRLLKLAESAEVDSLKQTAQQVVRKIEAIRK
ncbi:MAG TPA: HEAT repeat domain-containing protein [Gemmatales bacterium]|nr:HEAT repeat domain-containing protein [Gemmatales bacterium]HMP15392.1 HEAT repeat domain-containing protein [Gemmatales bacterium]